MSKKVTFILGGLTKGGAERVVNNLSNYLIKDSYDVDIITLLSDKVEYTFDPSIKIINYTVPNKRYYQQLYYWFKNLRQYFKKNSDRTIVSFFVKINLLVIISSIGYKNKLIVSERSDPFSDGRSQLYNILSNILYKKCDYIVFQTKEIASRFHKYFTNKIRIIANPVYPNEKYARIMPKENLIVTVGSLKEAKNHFMLIDAINLLKNELKNYKVIIYGEGPLRNSLENKISEYKLEDLIYLPGNIENVQKEIHKAKIFILSSDYEGLSNALQEALSIGLCCITTDCLGANELIEEDVNGAIIPRGNYKELSHKINELLQDDKKRDFYGKNAYINSKKYLIDIIANEWKKIL